MRSAFGVSIQRPGTGAGAGIGATRGPASERGPARLILAGFRRWGRRVLERLESMVVRAVWDETEQRLLSPAIPWAYIWLVPEETCFEAIRRLPGGHAIDWSPDLPEVFRYWDPLPWRQSGGKRRVP